MSQDGEIHDYNFLWKRESERGEDAGRKLRPVCLQLMLGLKDRFADPVLLLPITSQPPLPGQQALAVPEIELKRAGLTGRSWVMLSDANLDTDFAHSPHRAAVRPRGAFSAAFARTVRMRVIEVIKLRRMQVTNRL